MRLECLIHGTKFLPYKFVLSALPPEMQGVWHAVLYRKQRENEMIAIESAAMLVLRES